MRRYLHSKLLGQPSDLHFRHHRSESKITQLEQSQFLFRGTCVSCGPSHWPQTWLEDSWTALCSGSPSCISSLATHGKTSASFTLRFSHTGRPDMLTSFSGTHQSPHRGVTSLMILCGAERDAVGSVITRLPGDNSGFRDTHDQDQGKWLSFESQRMCFIMLTFYYQDWNNHLASIHFHV